MAVLAAPAVCPVRVADRDRRPAFALLAIGVLLFLAFSIRMIGAPFGDSHDGRNAGVWAAGGRSILDDGPLATRVGTRSVENGVYANHPPLLYVETALFDAAGGGSPAAVRGPAWLGTIATLVLLSALLLGAGLRPAAAGAALALASVTPMVLVYGSMLDTPVASLPFGVAVLLAWERARRGRPVPWALAGALTGLAVLSGWQSLLVAAVVSCWAAVRLARGTARRRLDAAFAAGGAVGLVVLVAWLLWAFGWTLAPLFEQFRARTGISTSVSLGQVVAAARHDTTAMYGVVGALAVPGLVLGLADRRTRGLVALSLAVTVPYPLVFRSGAVNHDYWNFWLLLPVAVGLAVGCDRALRRASGAGAERAVAAAAAAAAVLLAGVLWLRPVAPSWALLEGRRAGAAAAGGALAPGQRTAWYAGAVGKPANWLALATRRPAVAVPADGLAALAASHPHDLVFVGRMRCAAGGPRVDYAFERAAELPDVPPAVERCR